VDYLAQIRENITQQYDYQPDTNCVLQPGLSQAEKLNRLWSHSEKLALGWALLSTPNKNDEIIMHKNLRVCHDCHEALKLISNLEDRKFIIRDANRFHHFDKGKCSCNDYW
jgi:DYW family of nucleic acid deaminases